MCSECPEAAAKRPLSSPGRKLYQIAMGHGLLKEKRFGRFGAAMLGTLGTGDGRDG